MGMTGNIIDIGHIAGSAIPMQIAEIASALDGAADVRLRREDGDDDRIMVGDKIDYAHYPLAADDTHIAMYAIGTALVDGDEIIGFIDTILHHLSRNELIIP